MDANIPTTMEKPRKTRFQNIMTIIFNVTHALLFALYTLILFFEREDYSRYKGSYYDSFFDYASEYILGFAVVSLGVTLVLCAIASIPRLTAKRSRPVKEPKAPKPAKEPKAPKPAVLSRPVMQAPPAPQQDSNTVPETLRQYKALLDEGLITEEEFAALKTKLLGL